MTLFVNSYSPIILSYKHPNLVVIIGKKLQLTSSDTLQIGVV